MRQFLLSTLCVGVLVSAILPAQAQQANVDQESEILKDRWHAILSQVVAERGLVLVDASGVAVAAGSTAVHIRGKADTVRAIYVEVIDRLVADPELASFFQVDPTLIDEVSERTDQKWVEQLAAQVPREKGAKSANATLTNPAAPQGVERSGFADLVALALDTQSFVAADKSAVTINLNALALIGLNDPRRSAQSLYREHGTLRRIGGSFNFGSKIPEKSITGFSGLPTAENLFDAIGWDIKYRLYGDRDPRSMQWYGLMIGYLGGLTEITANLLAFVPSGDRDIVRSILDDKVGTSLTAVKRKLEQSAQITFKAGGQNLTEERGKDKYTFALLADKGFGNTDITVNISYSVVDDVTIEPGNVFSLKTWSGAVGIRHLVAQDLLAPSRAIELSLDGRFEVPVDMAELSIDRKRVWRVVGGIKLPWGDAATIPVSVTYASDPNSLTKEKFFTGHIGVSYDFGAFKSLFKSAAP